MPTSKSKPARRKSAASKSRKSSPKAGAARKAAADLQGLLTAVDRVQAMIEFDLDGLVINANENFLRAMGYTLDEIKGQHHRMFCEPAVVASAEYQNFWAKLRRGEPDAGVYRRLGKGGREVWIQASYNPILDAAGQPHKVVKLATDITAQTNRAAESEGKLSAIDKAQAMVEFQLDGSVLMANDNFLRAVGYTLEEIKGQHHRMFCDPAEVASAEYQNFWAKLRRGEFDAGIYRRVGKDGREIWIQASYNPILDAAGIPRKVVKFATDITAQRNRSAEFEGKLSAIDKAQAVIEFQLDGTVTTANENFLRTLGYRLDEIKGQHHRMFCDPAEVAGPEYQAFWTKLRRGEFDAGIYRRLGKDGREVWIQASYNPIVDAAGRVYKVVKFATDITAQKNRAAEFEGKLSAIDKAQAVIEFQLDGTVMTANENFLRTLGYGLDEIKGQHHRMFCDPAEAARPEYQVFWAKLRRGEFDAGTYRRIGKGGKEVFIQASYNPIFNAAGKVYKVVKFATDITEQKNRSAEFEGKLSAIDKAQAMIEFQLDGTVITANDNFLRTLGYRLEEIQGKHHRMFCDQAEVAGHEYEAFWAKLRRGEFDAGIYKRIGRGGKEVFIQASYNPIFNALGKPYKVVKFAIDVTQEQDAQRQVERLIAGAIEGKLSERIDDSRYSGSMKTMAAGINRLMDSVTTPLREATRVMESLAHGNLGVEMSGEFRGEFSVLSTAINGSMGKLREMVTQINEGAGTITTAASEISDGNSNLNKRTQDQATALEETASSIEEITATIKQNANNATQANQLAAGARETAEKGGQVVGSAVQAMSAITDSSKKVSDIIGVIEQLAFQTNMLALNAAVEAARAGDQGRGFAVVAAEVRNLAQRSAGAAKEIKALIQDSAEKVAQGAHLVNRSGDTLQEIVNSVKKVSDIIAEITAASEEQASGIDQINSAVTQMDRATQQNAAMVEEAASAAESLREQARGMSDLVQFFQLGEHGGQLNRPQARARVEAAAKKPAAPAQKAGKANGKNGAAKSGNNGNSGSNGSAAKEDGANDPEWKEF